MIDTIFYYADTKQEYLQKLSQGEILARTIVFIEETGEIYKNGKMFSNYRQLVDSIELLREDLLQRMESSKNSLQELISNLRQYVNDIFSEELHNISTELESYEDLLDRLRAELANLQEDQGEAEEEINSLKGLIRDYASWKSATNGTLTTLQSLLDAQNGVILQQGTLLDTLRNSVTNFESRVDLIEGTFQQYLENYDITNKVKEIIGREIQLNNGLLHDFATITDVDDHFRNSIDVWFDALTPSWTQLTSRISGLEDRTSLLAGFNSRIEVLEGRETALTSQFSEWNDEYSEFLSALQTGASSSGSFFHLIADGTKSVNSVAAEIFGSVNADGSNITIKADRVFGLGDWILQNLTVDKLVAGSAPNRIFIDSTRGIKHESENFIINIDGSGQIAGGKISWDVNGDITINGKIIGTGNINGLDNYFSNQIAVSIGDWGQGTLKNWIEGQLLGKADTATLENNYILKSDIGDYQIGITSELQSKLNQYDTDIAAAQNSITQLNSYFVDEGNNVIGLRSDIDISTQVTNYMTNTQGWSSINQWAQTLASGGTSVGVAIDARITDLAGQIVRNASISVELTSEQLSQINLNADKVRIGSTETHIGDFVKVYKNHFSCWNFDLVHPDYYALRRYLMRKSGTTSDGGLTYTFDYPSSCTIANQVYSTILNNSNTYALILDSDFYDLDLYTSTHSSDDPTGEHFEPKYQITRDTITKAISSVLMDWSGITVLKDYINKGDAELGYQAELFDSSDHIIQDPMYKTVFLAEDDDTKSYVPNIIPEKVNVNINAITGSGSLAWGNIRWSDKYAYTTIQGGQYTDADGNSKSLNTSTYNGKHIIQTNVISNYGQDYYTPVVQTTQDGNGNTITCSEENGVLIIKNAYLVNPKIISPEIFGGNYNNLTQNNNLNIIVPRVDVV